MESYSVIDFVDHLIYDAVKDRASDIHLESHEHSLVIRFRIDGILIDKHTMHAERALQIISRIKIIAHIDIAKKRIPQDGKFSFIIDERSVDFRVSTFPTVFGEKIVIRILDKENKIVSLDNLGFDHEILAQLKKIILKPYGLILVTGPTGSGKTTTLYGIISMLNNRQKNIITLEDPVEYFIDGITQSQINNEAGFTFAKGIRSMLRQDPDIIMVGEIRDKESAKIAIEASLTGHLVLSTLHTNDAPSAIVRLMDMDIEPYLLNSSLLAVVAQRLVRKVCGSCKTAYNATMNGNDAILFKGSGCKHCNFMGTTQRIGLFELLVIDEELRQVFKQDMNYAMLKEHALKKGMKTLHQDGLEKAEKGLISLEELLKTIH